MLKIVRIKLLMLSMGGILNIYRSIIVFCDILVVCKIKKRKYNHLVIIKLLYIKDYKKLSKVFL